MRCIRSLIEERVNEKRKLTVVLSYVKQQATSAFMQFKRSTKENGSIYKSTRAKVNSRNWWNGCLHLMGSCFLLFLCTGFVLFADKKNFLTCSDDLSAEEYCSTMAKGNSAHGFCQSDQWPASLSWFPYAGFGSQSINQSMISPVD